MPSRGSADDRTAMVIPAVLLFLITCLAQVIAGVRGGTVLVRGGNVINSGENSDNIGIDAAGGSSDGDVVDISLGHRHKHHHSNGGTGSDNNNSQQNSHGGSFDNYVYSMSYQPEFCRENNEKFVGCRNFKEAWEGQLTIHGLWPNRDDGTWPSMCSSERLDLSLLESLSGDLAEKWPNVKALDSSAPGHESFWSHEWSKHGTCSGMNQHEYFSKALSLLLPTPSIVKENYGSVVKREDLLEGYSYGDGNDAVFVCKYGYLSEVRVCFEKGEGGAPGERVNCNDSVLKEDSCGDEIKIASFDSARITATSTE